MSTYEPMDTPLTSGATAASFVPLVAHYEACLQQYGGVPKGVDWPNGRDLATRYLVAMQSMPVRSTGESLLDLGCGPGLLLDYLAHTGTEDRFAYLGVDLSEAMIAVARQRWPNHRFEVRDVLDGDGTDIRADHVLVCGVLTVKRQIDAERMTAMAKSLLRGAWSCATRSLTFNVMSLHVDWTRDDLFYWPYGDMTDFVAGSLSRHFAVRADYGLHEYMVTVHRAPFRQSNDPWRSG